MTDTPPFWSVFADDRNCIGFLRSCGQWGYTAYDSDGHPLGLFSEKQAAVERILAEASA
jgi:hypothetical protein